MSYGPNTAGQYEGNLSGAFADHNRQGMWANEGQTEPCWELPTMESNSMDNPRSAAPTTSPAWNTTTIENTGMTHGSGSDYTSELPNH